MNEPFSATSVMDRIEAIFADLARDVNNTSSAARTGWLVYLALLAYFFITLAGVSHRDILLRTPISLPILEVNIGLQEFFLFAPFVLVLIHFGILLQHVMLSRKLQELHSRVTRHEGNGGFRNHRIRLMLHPYHYTQAIAGPYRSRLFAFFLHLMTWVTLGLLPILLLLDFQVTYLPAHDLVATWAHRGALVLNFVVLGLFGIFMRYPDKSFGSGVFAHLTKSPINFALTAGLWLSATLFSFMVATIPDEFIDQRLRLAAWAKAPAPFGTSETESKRYAFSLTSRLFEGQVDVVSGRATSLFSRNLIVTDADLVPDGGVTRGEVSISLRGRDLRYAALDRSDLHQADFTGAVLTGASLRETKLVTIRANQADFSGADLTRAQFFDAFAAPQPLYIGADLRGAIFRDANLEGADLRLTKMQGANLSGANLKGASLGDVQFSGAILNGAKLDADAVQRAVNQGAKF